MNKVRLLAISLTLAGVSAWARDTSGVAYVGGTLAIRQNARGNFDSRDQRECVITWSGDKSPTRIPYGRIVFAEKGSYNPRATLGFVAFDDNKIIDFLTLIYRDDANRTQILQVELKGKSNGLTDLIRTRAPVPLHEPPSEVTALASSLASSMENSWREVKVWSATLPSARAGAKAVIKATNTGGIQINVGTKQFRIDYSAIQSLEFGQKVGSRVTTGLILSAMTLDPWPMLLIKKRVQHLLTLGFLENGVMQAIVIELPKYSSRTLILELELRSGRKVEYESARAAKNVYG